MFLSLALVGFIVFLCIEFVLEQVGQPIRQEPPPVTVSNFFNEEQPPSRKRIFTIEEIQSQFRIVTPPNFAQIEGNWITVLCRWTPPGPEYEEPPVQPPLFADELMIPWTMQFGSGTWFARIAAESGEHRLQILDQDITVYVHDQGTSPRGKLVLHEGTDDPTRCGECHTVIESKNVIVHKSRSLAIGPLLPSEACFVCHDTEAVQRQHSKLVEMPGDNCAACHQLHGERARE